MVAEFIWKQLVVSKIEVEFREVHPGNSGGPVFESHDNGFMFVGLTTEYIPYVSISKDERERITNVNVQNSGYSVVEPADEVIKFIEADQ